ncbi:NAD(P)H-quinone oxidoreductase subunit O, chloroplastic [Impatiens glandulifera]|uniref:NAD(P)H-quinone oxidoreductase subunit O, chloroplastic n=1 Tax=Impatiens glandulifera TaxID=253017 RepID=UPI001FB1958A|nr:NAD(P)H-quinone oxidoreductase subunit O, chloroplastic [Impatiens glandulifera]
MALSAVFSPSRTLTTTYVQIRIKPTHSIVIRAAVQSEGENAAPPPPAAAKTNPQPPASPPKLPRKPVYSMKKGQIVRVDKEKYLNSINYLSVGHPIYFKGLDYIYEDRGEILDLRNFDTGEYALISWVGIPTAPAWLPTDMLIKSDKLDYTRI